MLVLLVALAVAGCTGDDATGWTTSEAESAVRAVRGLPVRVLECRGLGREGRDDDPPHFDRFACVAGARLPWERYDSVAVRFELLPRGEYDSTPTYELRSVSFTGGPGIP